MLPDLKKVFDCNPVNSAGCPGAVTRSPEAQNFTNLADFVSGMLNIVFYIATFLAFYFLVWGAFQYIMAQGKKEELAKARARISWALVGLIVVFLAYSIARFASEIFKSKGGLPF